MHLFLLDRMKPGIVIYLTDANLITVYDIFIINEDLTVSVYPHVWNKAENTND